MVKMDPSIKRIIEQRLSLKGVPEETYLAFYELAIKEAQRKNPNADNGWLRWLIALMVWNHFIVNETFPWKEPLRMVRPPPTSSIPRGPSGNSIPPRPCASIQSLPIAPVQVNPEHHSRQSSNYGVNGPLKPMKQQAFTSVNNSLQSANQEVKGDLAMGHPVGVFVSLENRMELMASRLGKRHEFFQSLQQRRDEANQKFPACTRNYRQWYAQSLVWKQWFGDQPFPGREPVPYELGRSEKQRVISRVARADRYSSRGNSSRGNNSSAASASGRLGRPGRPGVGGKNSSFSTSLDRGADCAVGAQRSKEPGIEPHKPEIDIFALHLSLEKSHRRQQELQRRLDDLERSTKKPIPSKGGNSAMSQSHKPDFYTSSGSELNFKSDYDRPSGSQVVQKSGLHRPQEHGGIVDRQSGLDQAKEKIGSLHLAKTSRSLPSDWTSSRIRRPQALEYGRLSYDNDDEPQPISSHSIQAPETTQIQSLSPKRSQLESVRAKSPKTMLSKLELVRTESEITSQATELEKTKAERSTVKVESDQSHSETLQEIPETRQAEVENIVQSKSAACAPSSIDTSQTATFIIAGEQMTVCSALESKALFDCFIDEYQSPALKDGLQCHLFWQHFDNGTLKLCAMPFLESDHSAAKEAEEFLARWCIRFIREEEGERETLLQQFRKCLETQDSASCTPSSFSDMEIDQLIAEEAAKAEDLSKKRKVDEDEEGEGGETREGKRVRAE